MVYVALPKLSGGRVVSSGAPADVLTKANVALAVIPTLRR